MKKHLPKKKKKRVSLRYLLWAILLVFLFGLGWRAYCGLTRSIWDGRNQVNLVFAGQPTLVASFSPLQGSLGILLISDRAYIKTTHGYGQYRIEKIWELGELEGRPELLAESVQESLGLVIDGWIGSQENKMVFSFPEEEKEKRIKKTILDCLFQLIRKKKKTNLTRWDLVRLWWQIRGVRFDKITIIDLEKTSALLPLALPDGTSGFEIDQNRLDSFITRYFQDEQIKEEDFSLEIVNATSHSGLAAQGARVVANLGGRVIAMSDRDLKINTCEIKSRREERGSYTFKKLMKVFDCQANPEDLEDSRAGVMIILGEDYWQKLEEK